MSPEWSAVAMKVQSGRSFGWQLLLVGSALCVGGGCGAAFDTTS
jgi:hypothetical protein